MSGTEERNSPTSQSERRLLQTRKSLFFAFYLFFHCSRWLCGCLCCTSESLSKVISCYGARAAHALVFAVVHGVRGSHNWFFFFQTQLRPYEDSHTHHYSWLFLFHIFFYSFIIGKPQKVISLIWLVVKKMRINIVYRF